MGVAMATVSEMVADAMARKGMTQQRLAAAIGKTPPWVNMILRRGRQPGAEALLRIADALELDRAKLVRQALVERTSDEWRPYISPGDEQMPGPGCASFDVIGTATTGEDGVEVEPAPVPDNGSARAADDPVTYAGRSGEALRAVGFSAECTAIRVAGDGLEPVAYDGQYIVVSPTANKADVPDGAIVYVTFESPGQSRPRAMIKRMYRYRLAGDDERSPGLPIYNLVPVNTRLKRKGRGPEPVEAVSLRHRQVREMYPVVGVIFANMLVPDREAP